MVSGIGKRTGHSTLKNAKEKASLPTIPHPNDAVQNYKTIMGLQYCLGKDTTMNTLHERLMLFFQKKHLNTASLNAGDSFLMNCGLGLEWRFFKGGPHNCKSHR